MASPERSGVRLDWPSRSWSCTVSPPRGREAVEGTHLRGVEVVEEAHAGGPEPRGEPELMQRIIHADALDACRGLMNEALAGTVDLVYVDPPFASERDYVAEARLDGHADGRVLRTIAYEDRWSAKEGGIGAYLDMLAPRLEALASLLSSRGTMWVHLDWRASYLVRVVLDEIFGRDAFLNEIVWRRAPNLGRQATSGQFGRTLDTILVYGRSGARLIPPTRLEPIAPSAIRRDEAGRPFTAAPRGDYTDASIEKLDAEGRIHRTASGKVYIKYFLVEDDVGEWCRERRVDTLWTDIAPLRHAPPSERTGYPTQKPKALLERILACCTSKGSVVVDAFAGSGTTGEAAHVLGRRSILVDRSPVAIATCRARLLRAGASLRIDEGPGAGPVGRFRPVVERIARVDGDAIRLVAPEEPLAWAVGERRNGVFRATWHSERRPGTRAAKVAREAPVSPGLKLEVRVWSDDGNVGIVEVAT